MVAIAQCPVIQEHDAHDWSFTLKIDGNYVPKYFYCNGVHLHLVDEMDYPDSTETNPELFEKLIGRTQEEQPEASPERIIGENYLGSASSITDGGKALLWLGGHRDLPNHCKLRIPSSASLGDRHRVLTSGVKRETTQTAD